MATNAQEALTVEELDALLEAVNRRSPTGKRNYALLTLMADTGLRIGEALALTTRDLVTEHGQLVEVKVRNGKGGKAANVALGRRAAVALAGWLEARTELGIGAGAVFCTISRGHLVHPTRGEDGFDGEALTETELTPGQPVQEEYVRQVLRRLADRAQITARVTPHTLRHTFATHLLRETNNLKLVQQALRHSDCSTTARIYSHLTDRDVADAVRALRDDPEEVRGEARNLAAQVLEALPDEVRAALVAQLTGGRSR
jgi:site-specific recombinase XerD